MKRIFLILLLVFCSLGSQAQITNRLRVDKETFLRYAFGRMQEYNPANLPLADSLYQEGVRQNNFRYKCLGLSLEMPVRFAQGDYDRMDETAAEIKELLADRKDLRDFYFSTLHEYCEFLVQAGRMGDAVLEARAMERLASQEKKPVGRMYAYRIIGLIQSYRNNPHLAIRNLEKAVKYCREARAEQDLPNLYILLAQEYVKAREFPPAEDYCDKAAEYRTFFPAVGVKTQMTRAILLHAQGDKEAFWRCYEALLRDPLYTMQADSDTRRGLDITYLRSKGLLDQALQQADSLGTLRGRLEYRHGLLADMNAFEGAYTTLESLMQEKDSVYIKVQNEDLAILDAEMNNAQLREEAQQLKARNQLTILLGFLLMFAIAFISILVQQWQLRANLDELRRKNNEALASRRAYQKAMDAKESENEFKIKILQNRTTNVLTDYEDFLRSE